MSSKNNTVKLCHTCFPAAVFEQSQEYTSTQLKLEQLALRVHNRFTTQLCYNEKGGKGNYDTHGCVENLKNLQTFWRSK